jgi:hypothetical protein
MRKGTAGGAAGPTPKVITLKSARGQTRRSSQRLSYWSTLAIARLMAGVVYVPADGKR